MPKAHFWPLKAMAAGLGLAPAPANLVDMSLICRARSLPIGDTRDRGMELWLAGNLPRGHFSDLGTPL